MSALHVHNNDKEAEEPLMSLQAYFAFVAACIALALLPGPIVTMVIANGLRYGTRAALTNVLGAQVGLAIVIGIVAVGLTSLMATMGYWFNWVRFAGAAYLVWLGIKLIRSPLLGVTLMAAAVLTAAAAALAAGRARRFFSKERTRLMSRISGGFMIGGGIWLALTRAR